MPNGNEDEDEDDAIEANRLSDRGGAARGGMASPSSCTSTKWSSGNVGSEESARTRASTLLENEEEEGEEDEDEDEDEDEEEEKMERHVARRADMEGRSLNDP